MGKAGSLKAGLLASVSVCLVFLGQQAFADTATPSADQAPSANQTQSSSQAGATAATSVEGVVVTATKTPETLFDVPAPTTVVPNQTLTTFQIHDMQSVVDLVPNASLPQSPDNYVLYIDIRGIQQTDVNAPPNFGIYRNGIYAGGQRPNPGPLFDVDHIEVVAGPQSGIFGRDAVGGTFNVVYATPTSALGGYLTAEAGNWDTTELQGAINVPVSDTLAVRVAGWWLDQARGEMYNATLNQYIDSFSNEGGRLSAKWTPSDKLSVLWMAEYSQNSGPSIAAWAPNGVVNGLVRSPPDPSPDYVYRNIPDRENNDQVYLSQDLHYDVGFGNIEWLTSYSHYHLYNIEDIGDDALNIALVPATQTVLDRNETTQNVYTELDYFSPAEKRLAFNGGVSYFHQTWDFENLYSVSMDLNNFGGANGSAICGALLSDPTCPGVPGGAFPALGINTGYFGAPGPGSSETESSFSVYGQMNYRIWDTLRLIATLRYTDDDNSLAFYQHSLGPVSPGSPYIVALYADVFSPIASLDSERYSNWSPSIQLTYKPTSNINLYAQWTTGFRPGGFNTVTTTAAYIPYGSETAQNYEIGAKTLWFNGRLGLNIDYFDMLQSHLLEYEPDTVAPPQFYFYYLQNVGSARTYGIEFSGIARPTSWWNLSASVGWENGGITGGYSYGYPLANSSLESLRTWTVDLNTTIRYPLPNDYYLVGGVNWHYAQGGYEDITTIPWPTEDRLDLVFGMAKANLTVEGYVNNALNSRPPDFVYGNGAEALENGETYGLRATVKF